MRSQKHHKRHERKDYYRKPYVHRREHDESRDYFYHGHQDIFRTVVGELGYVKQVVCYSRHELAYLRVVVERVGHILKMREQVVSHVRFNSRAHDMPARRRVVARGGVDYSQ